MLHKLAGTRDANKPVPQGELVLKLTSISEQGRKDATPQRMTIQGKVTTVPHAIEHIQFSRDATAIKLRFRPIKAPASTELVSLVDCEAMLTESSLNLMYV